MAKLSEEPLRRGPICGGWGLYVGVIFFINASAAARSQACPFSFREAGFIAPSRAAYALFFFYDEATPGRERLEALDAAAASVLYDSNVKARAVNVSSGADTAALEHLRKAGAPALPAAVLAAPNGDAIALEIPGGRLTDESVRAVLERAVSSPLREEIRDNIVRSWCVAVLRLCGDKEIDDCAAETVRQAAKGMRGSMTEMGRTIERPPHVIIIPAGCAAESVLIRATGLAERPEEPALAVLFGRGKRFGPALRGADITLQNVEGFFKMLGRNCACTTNPIWFSGPSAPLRWGEALEEQVRKELGYDPANPLVQMELVGVPSIELARQAEGRVEDLGLDDIPLLGYREVAVEDFKSMPGDADATEGKTSGTGDFRQDATGEQAPSCCGAQGGVFEAYVPRRASGGDAARRPLPDQRSGGLRAGRYILATVGALAIIAAGGSLLIFLRRGTRRG